MKNSFLFLVDSLCDTDMIDSPKEDNYLVGKSFVAESKGEVTIENGEKVKCLFKNESGWWFLEKTSGEIGWAPASHVSEKFKRVRFSTVVNQTTCFNRPLARDKKRPWNSQKNVHTCRQYLYYD